MKQFLYTLLTVLILFYTYGCKKFITLPPPDMQVDQGKIFANENAAIAAIHGLYSQMAQTSLTLTDAGTTIYAGLSADEIVNTANNASYDAFRTNMLLPNTSALVNLWQHGYKIIYHANAIIEGVQVSTALPDKFKNQLLGEALLVRSFCYYYLTNFFGNIPLVLTTDFEQSMQLPATTPELIYQQIVLDVEQAVTIMETTYPVTGKLRPNKWAATAMLARIYLVQQKWDKAEQAATTVITTGTYTLPANLDAVFTADSKEAIWQLSPVFPTITTTEGFLFNPATTTARPTFALHTSLLAAFESDDKRKTYWTKPVTVSGIAYTYPYKYKLRTGGLPYGETNVLIRLGEMYLIRAESRNRLNNLDGADEDINAIRTRAGLNAISSTDISHQLENIYKERQTELFTEWGARWIDLKRTKRINTLFSIIKPGTWKETAAVFPIPINEIETNTFLIQNPGY